MIRALRPRALLEALDEVFLVIGSSGVQGSVVGDGCCHQTVTPREGLLVASWGIEQRHAPANFKRRKL